ncbi:MAG: NAD(P)/FAD-dependent oxidoreductase [Pseudomonadota bacterium]
MSAAPDLLAPDLLVIGAGPAGLAAAATAAEQGLHVLLVDEQAAPGGQYWRGVEAAPAALTAVLGRDYAAGRTAIERLRRSGAAHAPATTVWHLGRGSAGLEVGLASGTRAQLVSPKAVLVASGALERPFPVPGWELPGVMGAGAAQALLKTSGTAAEGAVFAGTGPLLYLVAAQYLAAGVRVRALLDTTPAGALTQALPHLPRALRRSAMLLEGAGWLAAIARRTRVVRGVEALRIEGTAHAEAIVWQTRHTEGRIESPHIFLHQGVVPQTNLSMAAGLTHDWHEGQQAWHPRTDPWGAASVPGLFVAGDGAGIDGAAAATASGTLAALEICHQAGRLDRSARDAAARPHRQALKRERALRPFLDALHRPAPQFLVPRAPETLVCRCEAITRGALEGALALGLDGPNQLKSFSRAGMGPCQARLCGLTLQGLIAERSGRSMAEVGYLRLRPPVKPLTVEMLADLEIAPALEDTDAL